MAWWDRAKKPEIRVWKEPPAERQYAVKLEMDRLGELKDDAAFFKFAVENFEGMSARSRENFLFASYKELKETIGQETAEEFVAERLWCFSKEKSNNIKDEIWGGIVHMFQYKQYKTGRKNAPKVIEEWSS